MTELLPLTPYSFYSNVVCWGPLVVTGEGELDRDFGSLTEAAVRLKQIGRIIGTTLPTLYSRLHGTKLE